MPVKKFPTYYLRCFTCVDAVLYQQTQDVDPMLVYCWASGAGGGPTFKPALAQHLANQIMVC